MNTWGATTLNITGFDCKHRPSNLSEQRVIPDPTDADAVNTFLQGADSSRSRYSVEGYCTPSELTSLLADKEGYTERTLTVEAESTQIISQNCLILSLDYQLKLAEARVFYKAEFIEN